MKLRYFTLGLILIFSGILLEAEYPAITGSFIGARPARFGFGLVLVLCAVPLLLLSIRPE